MDSKDFSFSVVMIGLFILIGVIVSSISNYSSNRNIEITKQSVSCTSNGGSFVFSNNNGLYQCLMNVKKD